ncbi:hypothetical protein N9Z86_00755 [bacterium]|nr:hypothetical protein [bacterium]|tara:strand:+ start:7713 stop:7955 length:243 start_codon:yes stop_codon:yes gene_type:complete
MSFKAGNINVGGKPIKQDNIIETSESSKSIKIDVNQSELELLLLTIKNGLFRGEYVETVYTLTLKLQKQLVDLKYEKEKL